jgi:hypothetical protein
LNKFVATPTIPKIVIIVITQGSSSKDKLVVDLGLIHPQVHKAPDLGGSKLLRIWNNRRRSICYCVKIAVLLAHFLVIVSDLIVASGVRPLRYNNNYLVN